MLTSCVISLKAEDQMLVPPSMGQVLHAFFLDRVRVLDPGLAEDLHRPDTIKPFTVSQLRGRVNYEENRWRIFRGEAYTFRITTISPELSRWTRERWGQILPDDLSLAGASFSVQGYTYDTGDQPWAAASSYEAIFSSVIDRPAVPDMLSLEFYSPTTFRSGGVNYPLPEPQKVFVNLLNKWNHYSPVQLGAKFIDLLHENVFPKSHNLQTRIMHFDRYKQVGFTGTCTFGVRKKADGMLLRILHMLGEYAFYAGIGYKTTMGMGQARVGRDINCI